MGLNRTGRIHVIEDDIDITGNMYGDKLVDFKIEDNSYVNDTFIGTTVAKKITVNILNPDNLIDLENKTIQAFVGIAFDGELEEIPLGQFKIEKPENEEVKERTSFTGYDSMINFNIPYQNRVTYPIKASKLFEDVCDQVGLKAGNIDFVNADYMILGNPFTDGEDCRTVLSNIAQLAGGFAKIGRDDKVYIKTLKRAPEELLKVQDVHNMPVQDLHIIPVEMLSSYKDSAEDYINGNSYFEDFSKNNIWGEVNSVVLSLSDIEGENTARTDEESISKNGLTEITIKDNYFLINEEERNKVIDNLWDNLKGIYYLPFKSQYYGYPYLDSGDLIAVEDTKGEEYASYVLNHTFTYNGAFDGNIDTSAMTKTQTAYKNTQDTKSKFKRVERKIDKINGEIEDIIEFENETTSQLSKHEQTIESITDTVSNVESKLEKDYYTKTETNSQITQKADSITSEVNKTITDAKEEVLSEASSKIEQTAEEINTEVKKKVGNNEIISKINQSAEAIQIDANKISLKGKEINLTGDNVVIKSNKFTVDKDGNTTCSNLGITGGSINIKDSFDPVRETGDTKVLISNGSLYRHSIYSSGFTISSNLKNGGNIRAMTGTDDATALTLYTSLSSGNWSAIEMSSVGNSNKPKIQLINIANGSSEETNIFTDRINIKGRNCIVNNGGAVSLGFVFLGNETAYGYLKVETEDRGEVGVNVFASDEKLKKNIQDTKVNGLDIVRQIKHREFEWKSTSKTQKIGYVAQELEQINDSLVLKIPQSNGDVSYQINETILLPVLSKAIQELEEKDRQKDEIIQDLIKRVEALEKGEK